VPTSEESTEWKIVMIEWTGKLVIGGAVLVVSARRFYACQVQFMHSEEKLDPRYN
jgi:hypothetical protein